MRISFGGDTCPTEEEEVMSFFCAKSSFSYDVHGLTTSILPQPCVRVFSFSSFFCAGGIALIRVFLLPQQD